MPAVGTNKRAAKAKAKPECLTAQIEEEEQAISAKSKRNRAPRDLESQIEKLLRDHFKGWGPQQVDCTIREGLSLRQKLLRDKELYNRGELTMGKTITV